MMSFMVTAFMFSIFALGAFQIIPSSVNVQVARTSSVNAGAFTTYQNALMAWKSVNTIFSGTVPMASLVLPLGVTSSSLVGWTNTIVSGVLYVYSTGAPAAGAFNAIRASVDHSTMGVVTAQSVGTLISGSTMVIPSSIPIGATFVWSN